MDGMQSDPTVEASNTAEACTFTAHTSCAKGWKSGEDDRRHERMDDGIGSLCTGSNWLRGADHSVKDAYHQ